MVDVIVKFTIKGRWGTIYNDVNDRLMIIINVFGSNKVKVEWY